MEEPPPLPLKERIKAFEALQSSTANGTSASKPSVKAASPRQQEEEEDPLDSIIMGSPTDSSLISIPSLVPEQRSRSPSPAILGLKTSLIDMKEAMTGSSTASSPIISPPLPRRVSGNTSIASTPISVPPQRNLSDPSLNPLINFSPPKEATRPSPIPSLPPRKPTFDSTSTPASPPPPPPPHRNQSLTIDHLYNYRGHRPAVSTSSFHSVSLSSDGGDHDEDPPVQNEKPEKAPSPTPVLPPRPSTASSIPSSNAAQRRSAAPTPPPPPPTRIKITPTSPRGSVISSKHSSLSLNSTPNPPPLKSRSSIPVPPAARKRYESLFFLNLSVKHTKALSPPRRSGNGWRGTSMDAADGNGPLPLNGPLMSDSDRLDGQVIRAIWNCSQLPRDVLHSIWTDCDTDGRGSLDKEAFVKGMWAIDEELRKAVLKGRGGFRQ